MARTPFVSVVVPTFGRRASLFRLLDALGTQSYPLNDLEVIIVDDGSSDGTLERLAVAEPPFRLSVLSQRHAGPAAARNRGVNAARGELVVFFDDDVVPAPSAIAMHVAAHQRSHDSVVVGPMLPPEGWPRPSWIRWEEHKLRRQYDAMLAGQYPCTPRQFFTANASVPRSWVVAAGGFDVAFPRAEDVELGYRLEALGVHFVFEPAASVRHWARRSFRSWRAVPYRYGRADVAMHHDKGHPALQYALAEFHDRHPLSRVVARACVGHSLRSRIGAAVLIGVVQALEALRLGGLAGPALSALFNLLYWQGVSDSLGGPTVVWTAVAAHGLPLGRSERPRRGAA